jgi:hypothetical protein
VTAPLLRLLEQAHPERSQGDLLAMIEAIPDRGPGKSPQKAVHRRLGSRPRTDASMERRRRWASSGAMPPQLQARFTLAESAVLAVVAAEVGKKGACTLTIGHIAALAGVSKQTVRNALHEAVALGFVRVEERRLTAWRNAPNRVTIVSREWQTWLRMRRRGEGQSSLSPRIPGKKEGAALRPQRASGEEVGSPGGANRPALVGRAFVQPLGGRGLP